MGPYCKFCETRCFVPTKEGDYVKKDLKATCERGVIFDMDITYPKILNLKHTWLIELPYFRPDKNWCLATEYRNGEFREFEIKTTDLQKSDDGKNYFCK